MSLNGHFCVDDRLLNLSLSTSCQKPTNVKRNVNRIIRKMVFCLWSEWIFDWKWYFATIKIINNKIIIVIKLIIRLFIMLLKIFDLTYNRMSFQFWFCIRLCELECILDQLLKLYYIFDIFYIFYKDIIYFVYFLI